jgi:hypothetical protein
MTSTADVITAPAPPPLGALPARIDAHSDVTPAKPRREGRPCTRGAVATLSIFRGDVIQSAAQVQHAERNDVRVRQVRHGVEGESEARTHHGEGAGTQHVACV